ncbi:MAG: hypothetical protein ABWW69_07370 [Pyrodictiaceae archaeon]
MFFQAKPAKLGDTSSPQPPLYTILNKHKDIVMQIVYAKSYRDEPPIALLAHLYCLGELSRYIESISSYTRLLGLAKNIGKREEN